MVNKIKKHILLTVVILCIPVFLSGVLIGNYFGASDVSKIDKMLRDSNLYEESYLVEQDLLDNFDEKSCEFTQERLDSYYYELGKIGRILDGIDARKKLGESQYNIQKRKFHLLQIKTYILNYKFEQKCASSSNTILYYYSQDNNLSKQQGTILDGLVGNYNIHVFAIEYNYSSELNFVEEYYNITTTPSLIVNFNQTYRGFTDGNLIVSSLR